MISKEQEVLVQESQIRDILASFPMIAKDALHLPTEPRLIAKEYTLPNGRLDLLFAVGNNLFVIELKVVKPKIEHAKKLLEYKEGIEQDKMMKRLPDIETISCLVVPRDTSTDRLRNECQKSGISLLEIDLEVVLKAFNREIFEKAEFFMIRPINLGIGRFQLNPMLYHLHQYGPSTPGELADAKPKIVWKEGYRHRKPAWLIGEVYFRLAHNFGLVEKTPEGKLILTGLGRSYVESDPDKPKEISDKQATVILDYIIENPFATPAIYGVYSLVESVFELSKNTYPVPRELITRYFVAKVGKINDWKEERVRKTQVYYYANYARELGLLAIIGNKLYVTPTGINFVIRLQLYKALKMLR